MTGTRRDVREHNRIAWDALAEQGNEWTVPVSPEAIAAARQGRWEIVLTPTEPAPRAWLNVDGEPMEFSHSLELQIGGQIAAGFAIIGMYEDLHRGGDSNPLNTYMPMFIATRALKAG